MRRNVTLTLLKQILQEIKKNDTNYDVCYGLVLEAMSLASCLGYQTGVRVDPKEPEWPVFYIQIPAGQISWHMPQFKDQWDGHTTEEKFQRIDEFCSQDKPCLNCGQDLVFPSRYFPRFCQSCDGTVLLSILANEGAVGSLAEILAEIETFDVSCVSRGLEGFVEEALKHEEAVKKYLKRQFRVSKEEG